MIDFLKLKRIYETARDKSQGKPLDNVDSLNRNGRRGGRMHNCRLFLNNDATWRIELHGNTIANIAELDDGTAKVMVHNVETWPTMTTAARLETVLGAHVWKHDNKLRCRPENYKYKDTEVYRNFPPMVDGLEFHITSDGYRCINPEIIEERRTRVLIPASKPVLAKLREIRKLATTLCRMEAITYKDLYHKWGRLIERIDTDMDAEIDVDYATRVVAIGGYKQHGIWYFERMAKTDDCVPSDLAMGFLTSGLRHLKDVMYSDNDVYEKYQYNFKEEFNVHKLGA